MTKFAHEPSRRPYRMDQRRAWRVTGVVLLAHATVAWLLSLGLFSRALPSMEVDRVIMASVVVDVPVPLPVNPQPVANKVRPKAQARPVTPQPQPQPQPQQPSPEMTEPEASQAVPVVAEVQPDTPIRPATHIAAQVQPQPSLVMTQARPSPAAPLVPAPAPSKPASTAAPAPSNQTRTKPSTSATSATEVVLPSSDADYLSNPAPAYPRISKQRQEQGTVLLRVFINAEGRAEQVEIHTSSGYTRLDKSAEEVVKRWRYVPGRRAGIPEAMWFNVPIRFVLD